jgi:hypothetical protein
MFTREGNECQLDGIGAKRIGPLVLTSVSIAHTFPRYVATNSAPSQRVSLPEENVMRIRILIGVPLVFVTLHTAAQQLAPSSNQSVSKEIWQLTDDERIAERLNPQKMRERAASHAAALSRLHNHGTSSIMNTGTADEASTQLIIDGAEHPELFLPFELFGQLLRGVDPTLKPIDRQVSRAILDEKIKAFGYNPETFWNAVNVSARSYFEVRGGAKLSPAANPREHPQVESIPSPPGLTNSHVSLCRARLTALNAARDHFGRDSFDRFLYTVVAPTLTVGSDTPGPAEGAGLRYLSGGCQ